MRAIIYRWFFCFLAVVSIACTKENEVRAEDVSERVQPDPSEASEEEVGYPLSLIHI